MLLHKAADCRATLPMTDAAGNAEETAFHDSTVKEVAYQTQKWCLDSEAISHMTADSNSFKSSKKTSKILTLANDQRTNMEGIGDIQITIADGQNGRRATLTRTLHVSDKGHEVTCEK